MNEHAAQPDNARFAHFRAVGPVSDLSGLHTPSPAEIASSGPESGRSGWDLLDLPSTTWTADPAELLRPSREALGSYTFEGEVRHFYRDHDPELPIPPDVTISAKAIPERVFTVETGDDQVPDRVWINGRAFVPIAELHEATQAADALKDRVTRIDAADEILIVARHDLMVAVDGWTSGLRALIATYANGDDGADVPIVASNAETIAQLLDRLAAYLKGQDERLLAAGDHIERGDALLVEARAALLKAGTYTDRQFGTAIDAAIKRVREDEPGPIIYGPLVEAVAQAFGMRRAEA